MPAGVAHDRGAAASAHQPRVDARGAAAGGRGAPGVDLLHAPAYTAPVGIRTPVVVTIHDVSYERHPEWYPYRRDWLRRAFYRASARAATRVVTDSAFSASEIHAAYAIPLDRIDVVPLGVAAALWPTATSARTAGGSRRRSCCTSATSTSGATWRWSWTPCWRCGGTAGRRRR